MIIDALIETGADVSARANDLAASLGLTLTGVSTLAHVVRFEFADAPRLKVVPYSLNVRSGPGMDRDVISTLSRGDTVTELERTTDAHGAQWVRHYAGWSSAAYLEKI